MAQIAGAPSSSLPTGSSEASPTAAAAPLLLMETAAAVGAVVGVDSTQVPSAQPVAAPKEEEAFEVEAAQAAEMGAQDDDDAATTGGPVEGLQSRVIYWPNDPTTLQAAPTYGWGVQQQQQQQQLWRGIVNFPVCPNGVYAYLIGTGSKRIRRMCVASGGAEIRLHPQEQWAETIGTPAQVKRATLLLLLEIAVYNSNLPRTVARPYLAGFTYVNDSMLTAPDALFREQSAAAAAAQGQGLLDAAAAAVTPQQQQQQPQPPPENNDEWQAFIMFVYAGRIPLHGFLIGQKGERIQETRDLAGGARINIQEAKGRMVVRGTRLQVEAAVLLLLAQMAVYATTEEAELARDTERQRGDAPRPFLSGMWNHTAEMQHRQVREVTDAVVGRARPAGGSDDDANPTSSQAKGGAAAAAATLSDVYMVVPPRALTAGGRYDRDQARDRRRYHKRTSVRTRATSPPPTMAASPADDDPWAKEGGSRRRR